MASSVSGMDDAAEADAFWSVVYASTRVPNQSVEESLRYCRGIYDHAMDLIREQDFKRADRLLANITYLVDCLKYDAQLEEIRDEASAWIHLLDAPRESSGGATIEFTFEVPPRED